MLELVVCRDASAVWVPRVLGTLRKGTPIQPKTVSILLQILETAAQKDPLKPRGTAQGYNPKHVDFEMVHSCRGLPRSERQGFAGCNIAPWRKRVERRIMSPPAANGR